jgi:hypothetical protein
MKPMKQEDVERTKRHGLIYIHDIVEDGMNSITVTFKIMFMDGKQQRTISYFRVYKEGLFVCETNSFDAAVKEYNQIKGD